MIFSLTNKISHLFNENWTHLKQINRAILDEKQRSWPMKGAILIELIDRFRLFLCSKCVPNSFRMKVDKRFVRTSIHIVRVLKFHESFYAPIHVQLYSAIKAFSSYLVFKYQKYIVLNSFLDPIELCFFIAKQVFNRRSNKNTWKCWLHRWQTEKGTIEYEVELSLCTY